MASPGLLGSWEVGQGGRGNSALCVEMEDGEAKGDRSCGLADAWLHNFTSAIFR